MKMRRSGWLAPRFLLLFYLLIALTPLALAWAQGLPRRPLVDELSSALAAVGFAMLLIGTQGDIKNAASHLMSPPCL